MKELSLVREGGRKRGRDRRRGVQAGEVKKWELARKRGSREGGI